MPASAEGKPVSPEQRQAAADDAVDKGDDFLPAVFVIPAYNHVHESVGQMGIEHFKLRVGSIAKLTLPGRDAGGPGKINHPPGKGRAGSAENQHAAGVPVLLHHGIEGGDQRAYVKAVNELKGFPESIQKLLLDALQQGKAIAVVRIKGGPVQLRQLADFLDGDFINRLFSQQE